MLRLPLVDLNRGSSLTGGSGGRRAAVGGCGSSGLLATMRTFSGLVSTSCSPGGSTSGCNAGGVTGVVGAGDAGSITRSAGARRGGYNGRVGAAGHRDFGGCGRIVS